MILYLFTVLENISYIALTTMITCFVFVFFTTIASIVEYHEEDRKEMIKTRKKFMLPMIIATMISIFIPNKKELATIYVLENQNIQETIKNIPEITKLTTEYLINNLKKE